MSETHLQLPILIPKAKLGRVLFFLLMLLIAGIFCVYLLLNPALITMHSHIQWSSPTFGLTYYCENTSSYRGRTTCFVLWKDHAFNIELLFIFSSQMLIAAFFDSKEIEIHLHEIISRSSNMFGMRVRKNNFDIKTFKAIKVIDPPSFPMTNTSLLIVFVSQKKHSNIYIDYGRINRAAGTSLSANEMATQLGQLLTLPVETLYSC